MDFSILKKLVLSFIPIFIAMGPLGNITVFISLTHMLSKKERLRVIRDTVVTASLIVITFIYIGKAIFGLLGITIADFKVAGGILLLLIAIRILLSSEKVKSELKKIGVVPLGTPLVAGPAVLTTVLILVDIYGIMFTIISLILNILCTGLIFWQAEYLSKKMGTGGTLAIAKITGLLLAAIAVMMIRKGISEIIGSWILAEREML